MTALWDNSRNAADIVVPALVNEFVVPLCPLSALRFLKSRSAQQPLKMFNEFKSFNCLNLHFNLRYCVQSSAFI